MGIQLLGFRHEFYGTADVSDTLWRQVLEGNLTAVAVEVDTIVGRSISVCGQGVVGAAGVVACTLTGILPQEHAAGIDDTFCQLFLVLSLDDQVLRGIEVRESNHLFSVVDQYEIAVLQGLGRHLLTWKGIQLAGNLLLYLGELGF